MFSCIDDVTHWPNICAMAERLRSRIKCIQVRWNNLQEGTAKINTNGSFFMETNRDGIGGIIRDWNGDMIMAFSIPIICSSNNMADALAAEFGGKWCSQTRLH